MPGIAGVISRRPAGECQRLVRVMVGSMVHEPFYQSGTCSVPELGVYAGFTAFPDSFTARTLSDSGLEGATVIVAGECFTGQGTLPPNLGRMYRQVGDRFVGQLSGLFSGVLIDHHEHRVLLFNDRYGGERIYFYETPDTTYFASEAKALLCILPELRAFDDVGVAQYLAFGCTLGWQTLFRGVRLMDGASLWSFQKGACRKEHYFAAESWESQPTLTAETFQSRFKDAFRRILPRYVGSDSRIGVSLTGGLDTRMIMASLPGDLANPVCYTFSGRQGRTLDEQIAARVASACDLEHHVLRVGADFLTDYLSYVDRTVYVTDGTAGALGAHEIYLNALARQLAPVRLTGNFGSEVLRGMSTFKPINLSADLFRADFGSSVASSSSRPPGGNEHPVTFSAFREIPWSLFGTLAAGRSQVTFRTPYLDNDLVALAFQAPASSRRSSDSALRLISDSNPKLAAIPTDRGLVADDPWAARLMRRALAEVSFKLDYLHKEGLPPTLLALEFPMAWLFRSGVLGIHRYLPFRPWFRRELATQIVGVLTDPRTARLSYWNPGFLGSMARDHVDGKRNYVREINAVLTLEAIDRLLLNYSSASNRSCQMPLRSNEPADQSALT